MAMACCIADVAPIGMTAFKADGDSLQNEQWVSIEGKVSTRDFHGRQQPYVEIHKNQISRTNFRLCLPIKQNYTKKTRLYASFLLRMITFYTNVLKSILLTKFRDTSCMLIIISI